MDWIIRVEYEDEELFKVYDSAPALKLKRSAHCRLSSLCASILQSDVADAQVDWSLAWSFDQYQLRPGRFDRNHLQENLADAFNESQAEGGESATLNFKQAWR